MADSFSGTVEGHVADGFEPVVEKLAGVASASGEVNVGVAITVEGETVVDVRWAADGAEVWSPETLVCVYSCTKGITALAAQMLCDRGLLDPEERVATYWPEFGVNGKERALVRHVLNHTVGVFTFPYYWDVIGARSERIVDDELIAEHLAASKPLWEPGTGVGYHALTYGWMVGELVRRVDGRSIGRFFADEVATPLALDAWIGLPPSEHHRVAPTLAPPDAPEETREEGLRVFEEARRKLREGDFESPDSVWLASVFMPVDYDDSTMYLVDTMNRPDVRAAELPGGNALATAAGLAGMYAPLANGGVVPAGRPGAGTQLVSNEVIEDWRLPRNCDDGTVTGYGLGYAIYGEGFGGEGVPGTAFGHSGAGGNLALADPTRRLSYAYVKNRMLWDPEIAYAPLRATYPLL